MEAVLWQVRTSRYPHADAAIVAFGATEPLFNKWHALLEKPCMWATVPIPWNPDTPGYDMPWSSNGSFAPAKDSPRQGALTDEEWSRLAKYSEIYRLPVECFEFDEQGTLHVDYGGGVRRWIPDAYDYERMLAKENPTPPRLRTAQSTSSSVAYSTGTLAPLAPSVDPKCVVAYDHLGRKAYDYPCSVKIMLVTTNSAGDHVSLCGVRADARLKNYTNICSVGSHVPASTTPPDQVLIAARKELPNAPQALFDSLSRETDKLPWGIHSFVANGTRELHTVYVYVLDITHLTHWSDPCAWVDSARPADGGWVPGTVKMRSITTFEQAAEHSYHYWRSCYLRGLIYAWEKHLSDQPKPEPILPKELSAPSPLPSPPSSPKLAPNSGPSVEATMPTFAHRMLRLSTTVGSEKRPVSDSGVIPQTVPGSPHDVLAPAISTQDGTRNPSASDVPQELKCVGNPSLGRGAGIRERKLSVPDDALVSEATVQTLPEASMQMPLPPLLSDSGMSATLVSEATLQTLPPSSFVTHGNPPTHDPPPSPPCSPSATPPGSRPPTPPPGDDAPVDGDDTHPPRIRPRMVLDAETPMPSGLSPPMAPRTVDGGAPTVAGTPADSGTPAVVTTPSVGGTPAASDGRGDGSPPPQPGRMSTPAGYVPFRSGPIPSLTSLPESLQIETLRLYVTQLVNELYNLGVAHAEALQNAQAEATRERGMRGVALNAKLEAEAKVKAAEAELTQLKAEHESLTRAIRRITDERDTIASKVAASTAAASQATTLARQACENDMNTLADNIRSLRATVLEKTAELEEADRREGHLLSRAEAAEGRVSSSRAEELSESLKNAVREADHGRRRILEHVTALADKTKECEAIRAELDHIKSGPSPWQQVGGTTPRGESSTPRSGAAVGSDSIPGREDFDARIRDLEGHIAELQGQHADKCEVIESLSEQLDQAQAIQVEADDRVNSLLISLDDALEQVRVSEAEHESTKAAHSASEARRTSDAAAEDSVLAASKADVLRLEAELAAAKEALSEAMKEAATANGTAANLRNEIATLTRKLAESARDNGANQTKVTEADVQLARLKEADRDMRILLASRDKELTVMKGTIESLEAKAAGLQTPGPSRAAEDLDAKFEALATGLNSRLAAAIEARIAVHAPLPPASALPERKVPVAFAAFMDPSHSFVAERGRLASYLLEDLEVRLLPVDPTVDMVASDVSDLSWVPHLLVPAIADQLLDPSFQSVRGSLQSVSVVDWLVRAAYMQTRRKPVKTDLSSLATEDKAPDFDRARYDDDGADSGDDAASVVSEWKVRARSVARNPEARKWVDLSKDTASNQAKHFSSSPASEAIRELVLLTIDTTGGTWYTRTCFTPEIMSKWAYWAIAHDAPHREAGIAANAFRENDLKFPSDLGSSNTETKAEAWNGLRRKLNAILSHAMEVGASWPRILRQWALAAMHKTHGNQQMLTWIDEAQSDTVLSQCPPLQADYIINLGDRTYGAGSQRYGSTSQTSDWRQCNSRRPTETLGGCASRHIKAYIKKIGDPAINPETVWENKTYREELNTQYERSILNDLGDAARGAANHTEFTRELTVRTLRFKRDKCDASELSCQCIADELLDGLEVNREREYRTQSQYKQHGVPGLTLMAGAVQPGNAQTTETGPGVTGAPPPAASDTASVNGVIPPGKGEKGGEKGRGANGRGGDGRGGGRGAYGREPPPSGGPPSKAGWEESRYRAASPSTPVEFGAPPNNQGHPWASLDPARTWSSAPDDWKNCFVDFWWMRELLKHPDCVPALAQCWPADATCAAVGTIPDPRSNDTWTIDTCRYCRFRALPPEGTDKAQIWWYGTGDGKHSPNRCPRLRRFLANGGDSVKFKDQSKHIVSALRMKKDYADQHKPAQK